jgi:hypothetical protein
MKCCMSTVAGIVLCAVTVSGCGEPNPGPVGKTQGGGNAVQFPFGEPKNAKAKPKGKGLEGIDTSKFPPK